MDDQNNNQGNQPQPPMQPNQVHPDYQDKGMSLTTKLLIWIPIGFIGVTFMAGLIYGIATSDEDVDDSPSARSSIQESETSVDAESSLPVVAAIKKGIEKEYSIISNRSDVNTYNVPVYQASFDGYASVPGIENGGYSAIIKKSDVASREFIKNILQQNEFDELETNVPTETLNALNAYDIYQDANTTCSVLSTQELRSNPDTGPGVDSIEVEVITVGCGLTADISSASDLIEPFYEAYYDSFTAELGSGNLFLRIDESSESINQQFPEYTTIGGGSSNGIGGGRAFYYKETGTDTWVYTHGGHDSPLCDEFLTIDSRKAFSDTQCYTSNTGTLVDVSEFYEL